MDTIAKRKQLGSRIRRLRNERQINRKQFALMIGMDRGYLAGIETGKFNATFDKLVDIADGLGISRYGPSPRGRQGSRARSSGCASSLPWLFSTWSFTPSQ